MQNMVWTVLWTVCFNRRPDYISPLDDLAFDMYQDPQTAQLIRQLEKKKQEAVMSKSSSELYLHIKSK